MFLYNTHRFYAKWLWDIQDAQKPDGDISDINPPYLAPARGFYTGNVTWPSTFIVIPGELYRMYGDLRPLRQHYAAMALWTICWNRPPVVLHAPTTIVHDFIDEF